MAASSSTTLIIHPPFPSSLLLGLDLSTFSSTRTKPIRITSLPPGPHFLFSAPHRSSSLRSGAWFFIAPSPPPSSPSRASHLHWQWDPETETLRCCPPPSPPSISIDAHAHAHAGEQEHEHEQGAGIGITYAALSQSPQSASAAWRGLTGHITRAVLARFFRSADADEEGEWGYISSASDADGEEDEESMRIPGLQTATETETKVRMLGIDLRRTFPPHAVGRERTEGARDRSWALRRVVGEVGGVAVAAGRKSESEGGKDDGKEEEEEWGAGVLGQMEVVFLMAVVLGNWACAREWERICGLVLTCRKLVREQEGFFAGFLGVLGRQLAESESGDGGLWEMFGMEGGGGEGGEWLKGLLKGFRGILREELEDEEGEGVKKAMEEVVKWVQGVWGWEIGEGRDDIVRRGMLELEDGEMVEMDIGEEEYVEGDERGEWAPVVVEL